MNELPFNKASSAFLYLKSLALIYRKPSGDDQRDFVDDYWERKYMQDEKHFSYHSVQLTFTKNTRSCTRNLVRLLISDVCSISCVLRITNLKTSELSY